jgi:hypothetical protein
MNDPMSLTPQADPKPEPPVAAPPEKRSAWRLINLALLLFGFLGPWFASCSTVINGFQTIQVAAGAASISDSTGPDYLRPALFIVAAIGISCILAYWAVNLLLVITWSTRPVWLRLARALLVAGAAGLSTGFAFIAATQWGYWLTWVGLGSSAACEWDESQKRKVYKPDDLTDG